MAPRPHRRAAGHAAAAVPAINRRPALDAVAGEHAAGRLIALADGSCEGKHDLRDLYCLNSRQGGVNFSWIGSTAHAVINQSLRLSRPADGGLRAARFDLASDIVGRSHCSHARAVYRQLQRQQFQAAHHQERPARCARTKHAAPPIGRSAPNLTAPKAMRQSARNGPRTAISSCQTWSKWPPWGS